MKKKRHLISGLSLTKNKLFFGSFMMFLTGVLIINATFAWTSYAKWLKNHMQNPKEQNVSIVVEGNLKGNILTHTSDVQAALTVRNTGQAPAFIRVNLVEILMPFAVDATDQTGNGHLTDYGSLGSHSEVFLDLPSTWQVGGRYTPDLVKFYELNGNYRYAFKTGEIRPTELTYVTHRLGTIDPIIPPVTGYWLYQEQGGTGYYYYSQKVQPGERTTVLFDNAHLNADAPNRLKGSLYRIDATAEAGQANSGVYDMWQLSPTVNAKIYNHYVTLLGGS